METLATLFVFILICLVLVGYVWLVDKLAVRYLLASWDKDPWNSERVSAALVCSLAGVFAPTLIFLVFYGLWNLASYIATSL
jgi:hypothetical protein